MVARRPSGSRPGAGGLPEGLTGGSGRPAPIPKLNVDPVWSLKPWPVTVVLGTKAIEIPAMPAADWLSYLLQQVPDLDGLILDLLEGGEELLYTEKITVDELYESALQLISTVCGRPWWIALRQINVAFNSWQVLGPKLLERIDFERVSVAAFLDVLLVVTLESMDPKDTTMFVAKLESPPPELAQEQPLPIDSMEMNRGAFLSMQ